jgi:hypothetical protein
MSLENRLEIVEMLKKNWQIQQREAILKREKIPDLKIKLKSGKKKPAWTLAEKKQ